MTAYVPKCRWCTAVAFEWEHSRELCRRKMLKDQQDFLETLRYDHAPAD